jgi:hypothetical protein
LRQRAAKRQLPRAGGPDDGVDLAFDDPVRIGPERNLRFVAGLDVAQLVLGIERKAKKPANVPTFEPTRNCKLIA